MAKFVLKDAVVLYGGRDLSGELSSVGMDFSIETPEFTAMGDNSKRHLPGVVDSAFQHRGWWDAISAADSLDADLFAKIAAASELMSMSPDGGQIGEIAYAVKVQAAEYSPGASHGEVFAFDINVMGDGKAVRGLVMENGVFTVTANGTGRQVGDVPDALTTIYSSVHVVAASGSSPTLDVTVESDDDSGFGTALTRMTHPQFIGVGSNRQTLVGTVTDDWWRLVLTIGGGTPSFTVFGSIGIQTTL